MKNYKKIALLTALALTASVFAQETDFLQPSEETTSTTEFTPSSSYSEPAAPAPIAPTTVSNQNNGNKKIKLRYSGDLTLSPYWELNNGWESYKGKKERGEREGTFLAEYAWNYAMGIDVKDKFSFDFRLSNPSGYKFDALPFSNASGRKFRGSSNTLSEESMEEIEDEGKLSLSWLPVLPNAYFTWNISDAFKVRGGLLEITGNTAFDIVAGYENYNGYWTNYDNWGTLYNNSQAGIQFAITPSDDIELRLTGAFPTNNTENHDARLIVDADFKLGAATLSPVIHTRVFRDNYERLIDEEDEETKEKNSFLWAYGLDAGFEFSDVFNFDAGIAFGHITEFRQKELDFTEGEKVSATGFIVKVAPSFYFGINEVYLNYSLGLGREKEKEEFDGDYFTEIDMMTYSDLSASWHFRMNNNIAFGPFFAWASESNGAKTKWKEDGKKDKEKSDYKDGWNTVRFGLEFVAGF